MRFVPERRNCDSEIAGSNLGCRYCAPRSTQPSNPSGVDYCKWVMEYGALWKRFSLSPKTFAGSGPMKWIRASTIDRL